MRDVSAGRDINIVYHAPAPDRTELRNLSILLAKVRDFWVAGVLEKSIPKGGYLELQKEEVPDAVEHPWGHVVEVPSRHRPLDCVRLGDVFEEAGEALLILGEAGCGKTITMLELARSLVRRAETDSAQPIPVILHLASWTDTRPLIDWAAAELSSKYQIPNRMGRAWLEQMRLLVMLDGLDEVRTTERTRCVEAINTFYEEYGMAGLVVCSREREYASLPNKLKLRGAIKLRPLARDQIHAYIAGTSAQRNGLHTLLEEDDGLRALAESPLMLNIIRLSYADLDPHLSGESGPTPDPDRRRQLFNSYIERMFTRRGRFRYSKEQTLGCLRWLARNMLWRNQPVFLIERLQTDWLEQRIERWLNLIGFGVVFGLLVGLIGWAFWQSTQTLYDSSYLQESIRSYPLPFWLAGCTIWVLGIGLIDVLRYELTHRWNVAPFARSRWVDSAKIALYLFVWSVIWWGFASWQWGAAFTAGRLTIPYLTGAVVSLLVGGWGVGRESLAVDIRTVEALRWSWVGVVKGLATGILLGVVVWVLWMVVNNLELDPTRIAGALRRMGPDHWFTKFLVLFALLGGGTGAILMGFAGVAVEEKDAPNQGIRLSLRSAAVAGLTSGACLGSLFGLILWSFLDQNAWSAAWAGASLGFVFMSVAMFWHGGVDVLKHTILRAILFVRGYTPHRFTEFLDHATELVFLRRVGGGYIFIHRLLLEHIAATDRAQKRYTLL